MRIGLDVRYISHGLTGGVRTYVYYLARELPRCAPHHEFFFYADRKAPFELSDLPDNVVLRMLPWRGLLSSVWNDARLGHWMNRDRVDLAHSPGNYGPKVKAPLVVTLHDALNVFPMSQHLRGFGRGPRQAGMMWYLGRMTRASLGRAAHVVTDSEHARQDIAERSGYPVERITAIHASATEDFGIVLDPPRLEEVRQRFDLGRRIILADGIKNPAAALKAYQRLPAALRDATQLVFFSREATPRPAVADALGGRGVKFIPRPATHDLVVLMNLARLFLFPSWYEGFGMPLVEAMRCGTPIVASTRASIPEVVGDAGFVFDVEDTERFAAALELVLQDDAVRTSLREKALRRAQVFTWRKTAQETLRVYDLVAS